MFPLVTTYLISYSVSIPVPLKTFDDCQTATYDDRDERKLSNPNEKDRSEIYGLKSKCTRQSHSFPWYYVHHWTSGHRYDAKKNTNVQSVSDGIQAKWTLQDGKPIWRSTVLMPTKAPYIASSWIKKCIQIGTKNVVICNTTVQRCENAFVDFIIGGGTSLEATSRERFRNLYYALASDYRKSSTRAILRRITELYYILSPRMTSFLNKPSVVMAIAGWSSRNLKVYFVVTTHWVVANMLRSLSVFLTLIHVVCGVGESFRLAGAFFEDLKDVSVGVLRHLSNLTSDNDSNLTVAVWHMIQLINTKVGYKQLLPCNHVQCADHSVQLTVLQVIRLTKKSWPS